MTTTAPPTVAWHRGPMLGLDTETTGVNVEQDRIVTAAIVTIEPGKPATTHTWLINPGIDIPAGATEVHGITTDRARAEGQDPQEVLARILLMLAAASHYGTPIVTMNGRFDLTLLDRELRRHGLGPLPDLRPVIDVRVLDKAADPYRKGGRKLTDMCQAYGVKLDQAHDAGGDALGALRVAWAIAQRYPELQIDPLALHERQIRWHARQVADFAAYRRRQNKPLDDENGEWPIRSLPHQRGGN
jgi:DNA polymerase-3 subunit epsilon